MKKLEYKHILICCLVFISFSVSAQLTKIKGSVADAETLEPLPFVTISIVGHPKGTITDYEGNFFIETQLKFQSLQISFVGYKSQVVSVSMGNFQELNILLEPDLVSIEEVIIRPGENPAHKILDKIIENKEKNDVSKITSYGCNVYNKMQVDINDFDEQLKDKRYLKQFKFVFENVDTSSLTGKPYLPVLISESVSDYYFNAKTKEQKEIIRASKISGNENASVAQFTGKMYQEVDIYDNFVTMFDPGFVSPIADFGLLYYKYFLIDSFYLNDQFFYQISFKPKRKQERTFSGYFLVHDTSYAIKKMELRITPDANINYVNDLVSTMEYSFLPSDSIWFLTSESMVVDFQLFENTPGFYARKTTYYSDIDVEGEMNEELRVMKTNLKVDTEALKKDDEYWEISRPLELTQRERNIYVMVDSVQKLPIYRTIESISFLLFTHYWTIGKFEYGPYYSTYSFNEVEGSRFQIGGRTSNDFSTKIMFNGHLAYGTKDETFKYGLGYIYMHSKNPRVSSGINYEYDIRQLGQSEYSPIKDNILTSIFRRKPNDKLNMVKEFSAFYEKEWFQGFSNILSVKNKIIYTSPNIQFNHPTANGDTTILPSVTTSEVSLYTRYAKNEKFLMGEFERVSLGTYSPIFELYLTAGLKDVLSSDYNYYKIHASISDKVQLNPFGYTQMQLYAGKIFNKVPFPLLEIHKGNETYANDPTAFNMLNYYEFASDQYVGVNAEHHFQGFFLNRIPLLRKLEWREVIGMRGIMGNLSEDHESELLYPLNMKELKTPYIELNTGIENIFKLVRVDMLWRTTHQHPIAHQNVSVRVKLQLVF